MCCDTVYVWMVVVDFLMPWFVGRGFVRGWESGEGCGSGSGSGGGLIAVNFFLILCFIQSLSFLLYSPTCCRRGVVCSVRAPREMPFRRSSHFDIVPLLSFVDRNSVCGEVVFISCSLGSKGVDARSSVLDGNIGEGASENCWEGFRGVVEEYLMKQM